MKAELLRGRHGHRVMAGETATPIMNAVTQGGVVMRPLRPDLLADAGVLELDAGSRFS